MTGRGTKRRGRPPKTPQLDRQSKFQYHLMKKPKYLQKGSESQFSTPTASRASSPQDSESSRRSFSRPSTSRGRGGGRGRKRGGGNHHTKTPSYSKKSKFFFLYFF